jgi:hypothetical protein
MNQETDILKTEDGKRAMGCGHRGGKKRKFFDEL